jgi:hypothetical protein
VCHKQERGRARLPDLETFELARFAFKLKAFPAKYHQLNGHQLVVRKVGFAPDTYATREADKSGF